MKISKVYHINELVIIEKLIYPQNTPEWVCLIINFNPMLTRQRIVLGLGQ